MSLFHLRRGDLAAARRVAEETLTVMRGRGPLAAVSACSFVLGAIDLTDRRYAESETYLSESATICRDGGNVLFELWVLPVLAELQVAAGLRRRPRPSSAAPSCSRRIATGTADPPASRSPAGWSRLRAVIAPSLTRRSSAQSPSTGRSACPGTRRRCWPSGAVSCADGIFEASWSARASARARPSPSSGGSAPHTSWRVSAPTAARARVAASERPPLGGTGEWVERIGGAFMTGSSESRSAVGCALDIEMLSAAHPQFPRSVRVCGRAGLIHAREG